MMRYQNGEEERNSGTGHELYLKMSCPAESHVNGSQSSYDWEEKEIQGAKEGKNRWGELKVKEEWECDTSGMSG